MSGLARGAADLARAFPESESPAATTPFVAESDAVPSSHTFSSPARTRPGVRIITDVMSGSFTAGRSR